MKNAKRISHLQPFRSLFDTSLRNDMARNAINEFIFRCLNAEGLPICVRRSIAQENPKLYHFYTKAASIGELPTDGVFLANMTADIHYRDSNEKGLVHIDCVADGIFGNIIAKHSKNFKIKGLNKICKTIGLSKADMANVPYSLLYRLHLVIKKSMHSHRHYHHVIWAIHSFGKNKEFDEFAAFAEALGISLNGAGVLSAPKKIKYNLDKYKIPEADKTLQLYLVWVNDQKYPGLDSY